MQTALDYPLAPVRTDFNMPLNETDRGWVRNEISDVLDKRLGKGLLRIIKDWGATAATAAFLLFILNQWQGYTEFKTHTTDTLVRINERLDKIENDILLANASQSPVQVIHEINDLSDTKFAKALPALQKAVKAFPAETRESQPILQNISTKLLRTSPTVPDYWQAVVQFLQFASANLASTKVPPPGHAVIESSSGYW